MVLQVWAQAEVDRAKHLVHELDAIIFMSTAVGALAVFSAAVAVLATVGSRWRFVSYACVIGICSHLARASSYLLVTALFGEEVLTGAASHSFAAHFARRLLLVAGPACASALLFRLIAFLYFEQEATGMLNTQMNRDLVRLAGTGHAALAIARSSARLDTNRTSPGEPTPDGKSAGCTTACSSNASEATSPGSSLPLSRPTLLGGKPAEAGILVKPPEPVLLTPVMQEDVAVEGAPTANDHADSPEFAARPRPSKLDRLLRRQKQQQS